MQVLFLKEVENENTKKCNIGYNKKIFVSGRMYLRSIRGIWIYPGKI